MQIPVKGTEQTATVDRRLLKQLPRSIWVNHERSHAKPTCRYEGVTMTLVRAVGLISGLSPTRYILPKNGDHFDCRARNAREYDEIPTANIPVYRNNKSGVKGIRAGKDGRYRVVLSVGGREKAFGSSRDLEVARAILAQAQKLI